MKVSATLISRGKFALGVLAVWAGVQAVLLPYRMWKEYLQMRQWEYRLERNQLCWLRDVTNTTTPLPPITWMAQTHKARLLDLRDKKPVLEPVTDDNGTLVLALHDWLSEEMETAKDPQHPIDGRHVDIQVITGPHSGRKGFIKRYLLDPNGPF